MAWHQQFHIIARLAIGVLAADDNFLEILGVNIADGTAYQTAFFINPCWRHAVNGQIADIFPHARQILPIAFDFHQSALRPGGANNQPHTVLHIQFFNDFFQLFAVGRIIDFARNTAAARRIGHQHAIASGQRQISGQCRALIAALLFHHLHQNNLSAFDDFLNFIFAVQGAGIFGKLGFFMRVAADIFHFRRSRAVIAAFIFFGLIVFRGGLVALFLGMFGQQRFAVANRYLVIIGMNFVKSQKAMPIAAIINKGGLQGRLNAGYFRQIDIAPNGRFVLGFKIKFVNLLIVQHHHTGFFRVDGIDKHTFGHLCLQKCGGAQA